MPINASNTRTAHRNSFSQRQIANSSVVVFVQWNVRSWQTQVWEITISSSLFRINSRDSNLLHREWPTSQTEEVREPLPFSFLIIEQIFILAGSHPFLSPSTSLLYFCCFLFQFICNRIKSGLGYVEVRLRRLFLCILVNSQYMS